MSIRSQPHKINKLVFNFKIWGGAPPCPPQLSAYVDMEVFENLISFKNIGNLRSCKHSKLKLGVRVTGYGLKVGSVQTTISYSKSSKNYLILMSIDRRDVEVYGNVFTIWK